MRRGSLAVAFAAIAGFWNWSAAAAGDCPGNPKALGVSRVLEVDTTAGPKFGRFQYPTTLALEPGEVVLTFDDGPRAATTLSILRSLDAECVKATFFPIGRLAVEEPDVVREVAAHGHTIGSHTWSHTYGLGEMSLDQAEREIEKGFAASRYAAGAPVAPFFRYPGLKETRAMNAYLASRNVAIFSFDIGSDDWMRLPARGILRKTLSRLERRRRGIILMHDIHESTAAALPVLLAELKKRGFRVVQIVPRQADAVAETPGKTPTLTGAQSPGR